MNSNQSNVVEVSDWSQKYKLALYVFCGVGVILILTDIIGLLEEIVVLLTKLSLA